MNFLIVLFMINWMYLTGGQATECEPRSWIMNNPDRGMKKQLGNIHEFRCTEKCNGSSRFSFFHFNQTTKEFDLLIESSNDSMQNFSLLSFDDGGEYCCSQQCGNESTTPNMPDCCTRVKIAPVVEWDLPKAVGLHGAPIYGSCSVTAHPRPAVMVITPFGCHSLKKNLHIGKYTNRVEFTITNATKNCEKVHCFIKTFNEVNSTELLIIENVSCGGRTRQTRSTMENMLTAFERGDSIITSRRLNIEDNHHEDHKDEDHHDEILATGNSSATATHNKLIIPIALLLLLLNFYI